MPEDPASADTALAGILSDGSVIVASNFHAGELYRVDLPPPTAPAP